MVHSTSIEEWVLNNKHFPKAESVYVYKQHLQQLRYNPSVVNKNGLTISTTLSKDDCINIDPAILSKIWGVSINRAHHMLKAHN